MSAEWRDSWLVQFPEQCRNIPFKYSSRGYVADVAAGDFVINFLPSQISATEFQLRNDLFHACGRTAYWGIDVAPEIELESLRMDHPYMTGAYWSWKSPWRMLGHAIPRTSGSITAIILDAAGQDRLGRVNWAMETSGAAWSSFTTEGYPVSADDLKVFVKREYRTRKGRA